LNPDDRPWHTVLIGIGSNKGDKRANCANGLAGLMETGRCRLSAESPYYCTEPVAYVAQDWFVNAVAKIATTYGPEELLRALKRIEERAGRAAGGIRFGPRELDLDILFYDDRIIETERLTIPHPRLHERRFVLRPLCDIAPEMVHPLLRRSVRELLGGLNDGAREVVPC